MTLCWSRHYPYFPLPFSITFLLENSLVLWGSGIVCKSYRSHLIAQLKFAAIWFGWWYYKVIFPPSTQRGTGQRMRKHLITICMQSKMLYHWDFTTEGELVKGIICCAPPTLFAISLTRYQQGILCKIQMRGTSLFGLSHLTNTVGEQGSYCRGLLLMLQGASKNHAHNRLKPTRNWSHHSLGAVCGPNWKAIIIPMHFPEFCL